MRRAILIAATTLFSSFSVVGAQEPVVEHANNIQSTGQNLGLALANLDIVPSELKDCLYVSGEAFSKLSDMDDDSQEHRFQVATRMMITFGWSAAYNAADVSDWEAVSSPAQKIMSDPTVSEEDYLVAFRDRLKVCDGFVSEASAKKSYENGAK